MRMERGSGEKNTEEMPNKCALIESYFGNLIFAKSRMMRILLELFLFFIPQRKVEFCDVELPEDKGVLCLLSGNPSINRVPSHSH